MFEEWSIFFNRGWNLQEQADIDFRWVLAGKRITLHKTQLRKKNKYYTLIPSKSAEVWYLESWFSLVWFGSYDYQHFNF